MMVICLFGNHESVPMHIGAFCTVGKGIQIRLQIYFAPHQILAAVDDHQQWNTGVTGARVTSTVEEVNEVTTTGELQPPPRNQEELHSPDGGSWGAWEATPGSNATPEARTRARARQAVTEDEDAFLVYTGRGPPRLGELPRYASHKKLLVHAEFTHTDGEGYQARFYDPEIATPHQIAELSRGPPWDITVVTMAHTTCEGKYLRPEVTSGTVLQMPSTVLDQISCYIGCRWAPTSVTGDDRCQTCINTQGVGGGQFLQTAAGDLVTILTSSRPFPLTGSNLETAATNNFLLGAIHDGDWPFG